MGKTRKTLICKIEKCKKPISHNKRTDTDYCYSCSVELDKERSKISMRKQREPSMRDKRIMKAVPAICKLIDETNKPPVKSMKEKTDNAMGILNLDFDDKPRYFWGLESENYYEDKFNRLLLKEVEEALRKKDPH